MASALTERAGLSGSTIAWKVDGMDCASCVAKIETAVSRLPGVSDIKVSTMTETLSATVDEAQTSADEIAKRVAALGYTATRKLTPAAALPSASHEEGEHAHDHDHGSHDHDHGGHGHEHVHGKEASAALSSHGHAHAHEDTSVKAWWQTTKGRLVLLTGALLAVAWASRYVVPAASHWMFIAATLVGVAPVAQRAVAAARAAMPFTIEMLMTIAAAGALVIGAAEEGALVVFLFAVGEVLEGVAANRARASIRALSDLVPRTAVLEDESGRTQEIAAGDLRVGQTVLVRPGDRIPADGQITSGTSGIDESPVTGESVPRTKGVGESVFAGSINAEAAIRVRVEKAAEDNTIARIIRLVEEAQEARAPTERFIDRFSRWYMPAIVGLAVLVALIPPLLLGGDWWTWIYRALALLLIGCPCALVISVPASIASALSAGARQGLLLKGGVVIESASKTQVVAFDKTGTLTQGKPQVTDVIPYEGDEAAVLQLAAAVETGSNHPLAVAIVERGKALGLAPRPADDVKAIPGRGMSGLLEGRSIFLGAPRFAREQASFEARAEADIERLEREGKTVTALVSDKRLVGLIALRDEPREDAKEAISELKALGIRSLMLTGDNASTGAAIAGALGLEHRAQLMPDDKVTAIKALGENASVMMIGDGINDAPALAAATVGIAMGSGTDVALETADGALLRSRVRDVVQMIRLARAAMANIRQNIAIALGLKAVFLVTSVLGLTGLWIAILADTGATVIVTANALRLLGFFGSPGRGGRPPRSGARLEPGVAARLRLIAARLRPSLAAPSH